MPGTLDDLINDLEDWLKEVDDTLESEPEDPMPEPVQQFVLQRLHSVSDVITQILNPNTPPNLPPDSGAADTQITAVTPRQYAQVAHQLSIDAKSQMESGDPDYTVVGRCLETINYLLPPFEQAVDEAV